MATKPPLTPETRSRIEAQAREANQLSSAVFYAKDTALLLTEIDRLKSALERAGGTRWKYALSITFIHTPVEKTAFTVGANRPKIIDCGTVRSVSTIAIPSSRSQ